MTSKDFSDLFKSKEKVFGKQFDISVYEKPSHQQEEAKRMKMVISYLLQIINNSSVKMKAEAEKLLVINKRGAEKNQKLQFNVGEENGEK